MKQDEQAGPLDYAPCHYDGSPLTFRGPKRDLTRDYVACLGGAEFYGKFVAHPLPDLLEDAMGLPCVNLGGLNAGVDLFLSDPVLMRIARQAQVVVLQVMGAQNMTNRFYSVHPRRNDRFVAPSDLLRSVFPEADFANIHFTRHALQELYRISPRRFGVVVDELKSAWVAQMSVTLDQISAPVVVFWMGEGGLDGGSDGTNRDPLFVDRDMLTALRPQMAQLVECRVSPAALAADQTAMIAAVEDRSIARQMFGPAAHAEAVAALKGPIADVLARTHGAVPAALA